MVKLEEIEDDTYEEGQVGPDDEEWDDTDGAESDISEASEAGEETLAERVAALRDIVPPAQRRRLAAGYRTSYAWGAWGVQGGLRLAWQVSVSVLLLVVPYSLVMMEDQALAMEEQQQRFREMGNEMMTQGADDASTPVAQQA